MDTIRIRGACTHNLKNVDLDIPRNRLVVITGPSGSGKSSLAFDTIHAEGQRRYVESLSADMRQFLERLPRPDVRSIEGLSPTIAIDQSGASRNPRSTVGTATEINDFLRLLFARAGQPHCPDCGIPVSPLSLDQMVDAVMSTLPPGTRFSVRSPAVRQQKGDLKAKIARLRKDGYVRVLIDDRLYDLSEDIVLDKKKFHNLDIFIDRLVMGDSIRSRLSDSLELALRESDGLAIVSAVDGPDLPFTDRHACTRCGRTAPRLEPADFSFNTPRGACPDCGGLGMTFFFEEDRVVPDPSLSLREGAIAPWNRRNLPYYQRMLDAVAQKAGIDPFKPWSELSEAHRSILLYGMPDEIEFTVENEKSTLSFQRPFEGVIPNLQRRAEEYDRQKKEQGSSDVDFLSDEFTRFMSRSTCAACNGARLKRDSLHVTVAQQNIAQICALSVTGALAFFQNLSLPAAQALIAAPILREITTRLSFLSRIGLGYLSLDRPVFTLSGGESQRIRLATRLGSALTGVTYILDEPSIGLHQRDHDRLLATLCALRDQGNSVIVVEHDADTMNAADYLVDMGPGAGVQGGAVIAAGTTEQVCNHPDSLTGAYLSGRRRISSAVRRRTPDGRWLTVKNASANNLKNLNVRIPLGLLVAITGVSGSGKSSLVMDTLLPALRRQLHRHASPAPSSLPCALQFSPGALIDRVIDVDQGPIGRTPRSNPATFTGVFADIRELFAAIPESKARGYRAGRYSFNVKGGRCEACQGDGQLRVEMNFLPDAFVTCDVCGGRRYNRETLEVTYRGRNIADVLDMTCTEAVDFLEAQPKIRQKLDTVRQVGLGYLTLGQNAATLSGGEAQRLKLARELSRRSTGNTLYILDEPTTGLHFDDVRRLLEVLSTLVEQGNTVIVIEHNLDVIANADRVIDLGPEGGDEGGRIVAEGTPLDIARAGTHTGRYLQKRL